MNPIFKDLVKADIHSVTYCQTVSIHEEKLKNSLKGLFPTQFEIDNVTHALVVMVQNCYSDPPPSLTQGLDVYSFQLLSTSEKTALDFADNLLNFIHYAFSEDFLFHEKVQPLVEKTRHTNIHGKNGFNFGRAPSVQRFFIESLPTWLLKTKIEEKLPEKTASPTLKPKI